MGQLEMFSQNIRLLIGILLVLVVGGGLIIAAWTGLRVWFFRKRQDQSERDERRKKIGRDGRLLPPRAKGICQQCLKAGDVFHLPDGRRLCPDCYSA